MLTNWRAGQLPGWYEVKESKWWILPLGWDSRGSVQDFYLLDSLIYSLCPKIGPTFHLLP